MRQNSLLREQLRISVETVSGLIENMNKIV